LKEDGEMFKKISIGVVISGVLMFSYFGLNTAFISPVIADEEENDIEKKTDELMGSYKTRSASYVSAVVSNEDVCEKCGKKKDDCTCEE